MNPTPPKNRCPGTGAMYLAHARIGGEMRKRAPRPGLQSFRRWPS